MARVAELRLTDGRRLGAQALRSFAPGVVDRVLEKLGVDKDGREIARTRVAIAAACRSAWGWVARDYPDVVPATNPFQKTGLKYKPKETVPDA